jgi:hypothetical protein
VFRVGPSLIVLWQFENSLDLCDATGYDRILRVLLVKTFFHRGLLIMKVASYSIAALACLSCLFASNALADEYLWEGGSTGNFSDPTWFDVTTGQHNVGPPGPKDRADDESGATLTIDGGSVATLEGTGGSGFDVQKDFAVGTLLACGPTITGPATMTAETATCDRGGVSDFMIEGGFLHVNGNITNVSPFVSDGGLLVVFGTFDGVTVSSSGTGSSVIAGEFDDVSILVSQAAQVTVEDIFNGPGSTTSTVDGASSRISVDDTLVIENGFLDTTNAGVLEVGISLILSAPSGNAALTVSTGSSVSVGSMLKIFSPAEVAVSSSGSIVVGQGGQAARNPAPVASGATSSRAQNNTLATSAPNVLTVGSGGTLAGSGRVVAGQVVNNGGLISPGDSPGILTIESNYEQDDSGTLSIEIGGTTPGSGYDQLSLSGTATLGGTLRVRLINGFTPTVGQTFRLLNASSQSGSFSVISQPSQAGVSVTSDATGTSVTVTSVVAGAPVINSDTTVDAVPGEPFTYQITATNNPTSFGADNLPAGLMVDNVTGVISGTPTGPGVSIIPISANNADGSGQADLTMLIQPSPMASATPTPSPTATPTPCTGRCLPTPRPRPTPHPRPTPRVVSKP